MSAHSLFLLQIHKQRVAASRCCVAPFEKGGYGGFAFDFAHKQEQIPLNPPFSKGKAKAVSLPTEVSGLAAP